jgi:hypothetical protein
MAGETPAATVEAYHFDLGAVLAGKQAEMKRESAVSLRRLLQ